MDMITDNELKLARLRQQYRRELAQAKQLVLPLTGGLPRFEKLHELPGSFGYVEPLSPRRQRTARMALQV